MGGGNDGEFVGSAVSKPYGLSKIALLERIIVKFLLNSLSGIRNLEQGSVLPL